MKRLYSNGTLSFYTHYQNKDICLYKIDIKEPFEYEIEETDSHIIDTIIKNDKDETALYFISNENHLRLFNTQDYMETVPVVLVYTGSQNDYAIMHAGSAYQNVELYTATNNMASIVRGYFDKGKVADVLNLPDGQQVIISQAIGWKK